MTSIREGRRTKHELLWSSSEEYVVYLHFKIIKSPKIFYKKNIKAMDLLTTLVTQN